MWQNDVDACLISLTCISIHPSIHPSILYLHTSVIYLWVRVFFSSLWPVLSVCLIDWLTARYQDVKLFSCSRNSLSLWNLIAERPALRQINPFHVPTTHTCSRLIIIVLILRIGCKNGLLPRYVFRVKFCMHLFFSLCVINSRFLSNEFD
jgi:hypothetical protein